MQPSPIYVNGCAVLERQLKQCIMTVAQLRTREGCRPAVTGSLLDQGGNTRNGQFTPLAHSAAVQSSPLVVTAIPSPNSRDSDSATADRHPTNQR